jgi:hypothetical protein
VLHDQRQTSNTRAALASAIPEAAMDKAGKPFFLSSTEQMYTTSPFGKTYSDSSLYLKDKRVAQLLILLHLLHRDVGGLAALPKPELSEIIASAVGVCGFVNPIEARDVIAVVLDAIETEDPIPERPQFL